MRPHRKYMQLALKLAAKGKGFTGPNPVVGAIIVKRGQIIGRGYHKKYGSEHAEVVALKQAGEKARNAIMYVTLEPCSHWGKTPPCTERIIEAGIREVIIAMKDPNPKVNGISVLKSHGIKTKVGILESQAKKLNEAYIKYMTTGRPFIIIKAAISLDGKIATLTGDSKYITCNESRRYVHKLRSESDAVLVGINTVLKDNPKLDVRLVKGKNPLKIVLDDKLRIPLNAHLLKEPEKLIIVTTNPLKRKLKQLQKRGIKIIEFEDKIELKKLIKKLANMGITSILIEGGSQVITSAIKSKIVDKVILFIAPIFIGKGIELLGDVGVKSIKKVIKLKNVKIERIGEDIQVEGYL